MSSRWVRAVILGLLSLQTLLLVHSAKVHSPTWDEVGHLAAGISHWEFGRFELYSVNPPLVRTLAAAPVYFFCQPEMDWGHYRSDPTLRSEVYLGRRMIGLGGADSFHHFFIARLAVIPIALLGGWLCFLWGRDLFGPVAGLIAITLWTFSPNVLAYGSLITPDLASSVALLGCCYVFWRWMKQPGAAWATGLGTSLALAMLTKSVWLVLPFLFAAIWLGSVLLQRRASRKSPAVTRLHRATKLRWATEFCRAANVACPIVRRSSRTTCPGKSLCLGADQRLLWVHRNIAATRRF